METNAVITSCSGQSKYDEFVATGNRCKPVNDSQSASSCACNYIPVQVAPSCYACFVWNRSPMACGTLTGGCLLLATLITIATNWMHMLATLMIDDDIAVPT